MEPGKGEVGERHSEMPRGMGALENQHAGVSVPVTGLLRDPVGISHA